MNQRVKETVKELKKFRKVHSQADFAKETGIGVVQLSEIVSGKRKVSEYYVNKILTRFPEINADWLRSGVGEMLKSNSANAENHSISIAGEEIKENKINVNTDETIAMLVAEVAAQRKLTEKVLEQNSDLIAIIAGKR
jgi:transcriptional regulator with XRE-family HTH domain